MENKKLLSIILKDMTELEEMISEGKNKGGLDELELEFVHSRAHGVVLLLKRVLNQGQDHPVEIHHQDQPGAEGTGYHVTTEQKKMDALFKEPEAVRLIEEPVFTTENRDTDEQHSDIGHADSAGINYEPPVSAEKEKRPANGGSEEIFVKDESSGSAKTQANTSEEVMETIQEFPEESDNLAGDDLVLQEDNIDEQALRLGDSFLKERSVNDLVTDHNNLEFKLSNRPVESIQSAIGINDRFQYIRELFDGDSNKFAEVVKTLDSMHHIRDAVAYLQHNFKWKKNDISLKFVNLVKRRFPDE